MLGRVGWRQAAGGGGSGGHGSLGPLPGDVPTPASPAEPLEARVLADSIVTTFTWSKTGRLLGPLSSDIASAQEESRRCLKPRMPST